MSDVERSVHVLASIARLDVTARDRRAELAKIPVRVGKVDRQLAELAAREEKAVAKFENTKKERKQIETDIEDLQEKIKKSKTKLTEVKTNHEYTAALKEIETFESEIDAREERLLELMDLQESIEATHSEDMAKIASERAQLETEKGGQLDRQASLEADVKDAVEEKPKLLHELDDNVRRQYDRLMSRYGDVAVVPCRGEHCGGCGTQVPPQVAVEVKANRELINCQGCGRLLVYYDG
jgi:predicted  nucleic acid-binding Zn-ribbon protein